MSEISVNVKKMERYISYINVMKSCWKSKARPYAEGAGRTVEEMELLADAYEALYDSMIVLTENTVDYLENVVHSFNQTDNKNSIMVESLR